MTGDVHGVLAGCVSESTFAMFWIVMLSDEMALTAARSVTSVGLMVERKLN